MRVWHRTVAVPVPPHVQRNRRGDPGRTVILSILFCLLLVPSVLLAGTDPAQGQKPRPVGQALRLSYWGEIPARVDSVAVTFRGPSKPLWEKALQVPYEVVYLPVTVLRATTRSATGIVDRTGLGGRLKDLLGPQEGPFALKLRAHAGGLAGAGYDVIVKHDRPLDYDNRFALRWSSSTGRTQKINAGIWLNRDKASSFAMGAGHSLRPNARYFGDGPLAPEPNESFYTQELTWAALAVRRRFIAGFDLEGMTLYSAVGARKPGDEGDLSVAERFDPVPTGYGDRSSGPIFGLSLIRDSTLDDGRPVEGGIWSLGGSYFLETGDGEQSFWTWRGEFEQYIRLWNDMQILAMRGLMTRIAAEDETAVPFQRLLTNDDPDLLRGYRDFRWRALGLTILTIEYRWPMWAITDSNGPGADCYVFSDLGQVFNDLGEVSAGHMTHSYGGGVRLVGKGGFAGRVEIARSEEETVFVLSLDQMFQHAKGGLLQGKDQVALR